MLSPGVYPAAVTPFDESGRIDMSAVARLLAFFESQGCRGAVLAGTNGEGPSLSAVEKRDLIRGAMPLRGKLDLLQGIATSSLEEAVWLSEQAAKCGAAGVLVMPPSYFKAGEEGIRRWFEALLAMAPLPVVAYNFPQRTGVELSAALLAGLSAASGPARQRLGGVKDSSGEAANLASFRSAVPALPMFVGDETLLWSALDAGWSGTISGAANVMPGWLSTVVREHGTESGRAKFDLALPAIRAIRAASQPACHKAVLHRLGIIPNPAVRLPLLPPPEEEVERILEVVRPFAL